MKRYFRRGLLSSFFVAISVAPAMAAMDFTAVQTDITAAVADIVAGGLILVAAYAGYWGVKRVRDLFATS